MLREPMHMNGRVKAKPMTLIHSSGGAPDIRHEIRGVDGILVAIHCRKYLPDKKKRMWWELPDGNRNLAGLPIASMPLYGSHELVPEGSSVVICEGEMATDALLSLGVAAFGTVCGAKATPSTEVLRCLVGRSAILWPDNDEDGPPHMARIGAKLVALGVPVWTVNWPDAPLKGDAADFVEAGLGRDELQALIDAAIPTKMPEKAGISTEPGVMLDRLSDVPPETVQWLWPGHVPLGKITVLDGDPGLGKSALCLDIAARVSRGSVMPDGSIGDVSGPGGVLLLTVEDGIADTVVPRLIAADADMTRIFALGTIPGPDDKPTMPAIPRDLAIIERIIGQYDIRLMIIDPFIAFLGDSSETNTWKDQDVRRALGPFAAMLERTHIGSLSVRHLNKSGNSNALYAGGGSIGIIGAARAGLIVKKDPDDETGKTRIVAPSKMNLAIEPKAIAYHLESSGDSVRVVWDGTTEHSTADLMDSPGTAEERGAMKDAVDFLRATLYGEPITTDDLKRQASLAGIAWRTIERARTRLHVQTGKLHGPKGPWFVWLPDLRK
ncbi:MAG: AAA family ATPase [Nitrospirota bacterium]